MDDKTVFQPPVAPVAPSAPQPAVSNPSQQTAQSPILPEQPVSFTPPAQSVSQPIQPAIPPTQPITSSPQVQQIFQGQVVPPMQPMPQAQQPIIPSVPSIAQTPQPPLSENPVFVQESTQQVAPEPQPLPRQDVAQPIPQEVNTFISPISPSPAAQSTQSSNLTPVFSDETPVVPPPPAIEPPDVPFVTAVNQNAPEESGRPRLPVDTQQPEEVAAPVEQESVQQSMPTPPKPSVTKEPKNGGFHIPNIIKIIGGVVIAIILAIVFMSIFLKGGSKNGNGKVTLTYWGLWEDNNVMQSVIADFERQNPNITVDYSMQDPKEYSQRLLTRIQNNTGPDVFRFHSSWGPMMFPVLLPLSKDVITPQDFTKTFYPVAQTDLVKNGAIYGIPLSIDTLSLFVNDAMFKSANIQVPTTWDNFLTAARALTVKDDTGKIKVAGAAMGTFDNITHGPDILSLLFAQNGANMQKLATTQDNAVGALTFYSSFANDQGNVWDNTLDPSILAFARGKLAMYLGYSWDIFQIQAATPTLQFHIYPVPHLPGRDVTVASYWVEGVSNRSQHQKEALLFMKFLAQKDTQEKLYTQEAKTRAFGELYSRQDLGDTLKSNQLIYPFVQQANTAVSAFFSGETYDTGINAQLNGYLGNAVRSMLANTSAQTAVDTLGKGVDQVLQQYEKP
ncbi:MAG: extracellular solute-binding protein [Candidatus Levyibacteriota bacterium]